MPEGAEVKRVADSLHIKISGKWIQGIQVNEKSRYFKVGGIKDVEKLLFPVFISRIYSKGKKILFECKEPKSSQDIHFISSLAMSGRWQYEEGKHSGIELILEDKSIFFEDQRHFGSFLVCLDDKSLHSAMKAVGPDLLSENVSFDEYNKVLSQKRISQKQICAFLLEQKYFSGVGNWVRAEVLYESRIAPHRTLESLTQEERYKVYYFSIKILREAYSVRGLTITNYIDPEGEYGRYDVKVYAKEKDPEGNEIVRNTFSDKRTMHWVPALQK